MKALWSALAVLALSTGPLSAEEPWKPIGPPGGEIMEILVHPRNPRVLWAATRHGGVSRSVDGGASWSLSNQGLTNREFRSLALAPSNPDVVYLAVGNWTHLPNPAPQFRYNLRDILIDPRDPDVVFLAWDDIWLSRDGGGSWQKLPVGSGAASFMALAADPRDPDVLYISGWSLVENAGQFFLLLELEVDPHAPHDAFAATERGLFRHPGD